MCTMWVANGAQSCVNSPRGSPVGTQVLGCGGLQSFSPSLSVSTSPDVAQGQLSFLINFYWSLVALFLFEMTFPGSSVVKNQPARRETWV